VKRRLQICIIGFFLGTVSALSQTFLIHRSPLLLENWKFQKREVHAAESVRLPSMDGWADVTVPHTWNAQDILTLGENAYQGIGWYRTSFVLPRDGRPQRTFVRFEGVSLVADVFLNGEYLGRHKGGYSAFCFELTPYVLYGRENVLAVKVDNSMQPDVAPSGSNLYPLFGGIYRPVTLFRTAELCLSPLDYASSGVTIRPLRVSDAEAEIDVETLLSYRPAENFQTGSPELLPPRGTAGEGLSAEYFGNETFQGKPRHTRVDREIAFDFGTSGPFADMGADHYSIRWKGRFVPAHSGTYRFVLESDDGSRLYLGDSLIINHWGGHAATKKSSDVRLEAGKELSIRIEYYESGGGASIMFGWKVLDDSAKAEAFLRTSIVDRERKTVTTDRQRVALASGTETTAAQRFRITQPHLWNGKTDPYLYSVRARLEDAQGKSLDEVETPFGLRTYRIDRDSGLILNGRAVPLYGVSRHQEWEGLGPALSDRHHERDVQLILELGATGVRLAHYQQAEKMYSLCDEKGLVVWAEIPNTPTYRRHPDYLQNCTEQLTELIKQNINHPAILFWGLYNEIDIPTADLKVLHDTARRLDPNRLTTQADYTGVQERHFVTEVAAWNWYFGWYNGEVSELVPWFDRARRDHPTLLAGLSEYGAGGCISQQQENPQRPDADKGRFFPEQYQRLFHENVWAQIKDRKDIWCKFIWNLADFSWSTVRRGDRDFINHKGLITHDRQVKKDAFYFYKANWSDEPVLYLLSRRNTQRTENPVPVEVYTNLGEVDLTVNGIPVSRKKMESAIHKIRWEGVTLAPGRNRIEVTARRGDQTWTDMCEWTLGEKR
jgi:hypothetical protein